MPTQKIDLTPDFIKDLRGPLAKGTVPDMIYSDPSVRNLELRVQSGKATWVVRYKKKMKTIGDLHPIDHRPLTALTTIDALRIAVRRLIDDNPDRVEPFLAKFHSLNSTPRIDGKGDKMTPAAALAQNIRDAFDHSAEAIKPVEVITTWTLRQCIEHMIERRSKVTPKKKQPLRESTISTYRTAMARPQASALLDTPAVQITRSDVEKVRDEIEKITPSGALKFIGLVRTSLDYVHQFRVSDAGLDKSDQWWKLLASDIYIKPKDRHPSIETIGLTLRLAEKFLHERMPGRKQAKLGRKGRKDSKHGVRIDTFNAFLWIVFTGQRVDAGLNLLNANLNPDPFREGWWLAIWGAEVMKGGRVFALPLPPLAMSILMPYLKQSEHYGRSIWAFPAEKDRHKCVNRGTVANLLKRLHGTDDIEYKRLAARRENEPRHTREGPVVLNGGTYWSLHDVRGTVVETLDNAGNPGGASHILAHKLDLDPPSAVTPGKEDDWHKQRVAAITEKYYQTQNVPFKQTAMETWVNAVMDGWEKASKKDLIFYTR